MIKPLNLRRKIFTTRLTKINEYIPLLPGLGLLKKTNIDKFNKIILHVIPNGWVKKYYIQGIDIKLKSLKTTTEYF